MRNRNCRGVTLVELCVSIGILTFIIIVLANFFDKTYMMFTHFEVTNQLKTYGQREIGRLSRILSLNKRLFSSGSAKDLAYLARLNITADPSPLTASKLPLISVSGVLSPNDPDFDPSIMGNCLFFAGYANPVIATNIQDSSSVSHTLRIDTYGFHYYYLNFDQAMKFPAQAGRNMLVGWHSQQYADYSQIETISDTVEKKSLVQYLYNSGYRYAWMPSEVDVGDAFYGLNSGGNTFPDSNHVIAKKSIEFPFNMTTGLMGWTYPHGIAFNTTGNFAIKDNVPLFAQVNGDFPGGFEIGIIGANTGRSIFIRLVLAAQSKAGLQSYEHISLTTVRDCW